MAAVKISSARRQAAQKFRAPQQCSFSNINRDAGPYGVRLSGCAGIRETADMDATVPLHDNRPARLRAVRGSGSGDRRGGDSLWAILRRITFGVKEFQRPWVFGGVFAPFCRRGQKGVAPEREISPPEAKKRKQNIGGGRGRTPPLRRDRRECASIRRCADAGRRGRWPLRVHDRSCGETRRRRFPRIRRTGPCIDWGGR